MHLQTKLNWLKSLREPKMSKRNSICCRWETQFYSTARWTSNGVANLKFVLKASTTFRNTTRTCARVQIFRTRLVCKLPRHFPVYFYSSHASDFPNEIMRKRLWLGAWAHAADVRVIETLKITHILNISDTCENYLEKTHRKFLF